MSKRTRTVSWCEQRIISEITKRKEITTYLVLSAVVLRNVQNVDEQHNLDIALAYLLSRKEITKEKGDCLKQTFREMRKNNDFEHKIKLQIQTYKPIK